MNRLVEIIPNDYGAKFQGKNDPRVPWTEAEQIVAAVRANGMPVLYLRADNEGHSFSRRQNIDFKFFSKILFIREFLLK